MKTHTNLQNVCAQAIQKQGDDADNPAGNGIWRDVIEQLLIPLCAKKKKTGEKIN